MQGNTAKINEHRYKHVPKLVETSHEGKLTILRNQPVKTDRATPNNQPDIIFRDNERRNKYINRCGNFGRQKCDQERSQENSKI